MVGANNRLESDGEWTYTYDAEGNRIGKSKAGESWTYTYDHRGQMTSALKGDGSGSQYFYDAFGNRIRSVSLGAGGTVVGEERYAVDGWDTAKPGAVGTENFDVWADLNASNAVTTRRMTGAGFDDLLVRVQGTSVNWYETDRQGSVRGVLDNSGSVIASSDFDAFGKLASGTLTDRYGYTGREFDAAVDLYHFRARMYDAGNGLFTGEDPIGFDAGDVNLSRYVGNGPTNGTDPSGMEEPALPPNRKLDFLNYPSTSQCHSPKSLDSKPDLFTSDYVLGVIRRQNARDADERMRAQAAQRRVDDVNKWQWDSINTKIDRLDALRAAKRLTPAEEKEKLELEGEYNKLQGSLHANGIRRNYRGPNHPSSSVSPFALNPTGIPTTGKLFGGSAMDIIIRAQTASPEERRSMEALNAAAVALRGPENDRPGTIGPPSTVGSFVPVYGSVRNLINDIQNGRPLASLTGLFFVVLDITTVSELVLGARSLTAGMSSVNTYGKTCVPSGLPAVAGAKGSSSWWTVQANEQLFAGADPAWLHKISPLSKEEVLDALLKVSDKSPQAKAAYEMIQSGKVKIAIYDQRMVKGEEWMAGFHEWGSDRIVLFANNIRRTPESVAGIATHEATHFGQGLKSPAQYHKGHEFDAIWAQSRIDPNFPLQTPEQIWKFLKNHQYYGKLPDPPKEYIPANVRK